MTQERSFLQENYIWLIVAVSIITIFTVVIVAFYITVNDSRAAIKKALDDETAELNKVKGDCKALGNWIIKQGSNPLNLDPVVDEAHNLYMVNCTHGGISP